MEYPELVVVYSHSAGQNVRLSRMPHRGETARALTWDLDRDGAKGTNVAVAADRLGIRTALVSRTGDDFWADAADGLLKGTQVDRRFLLRDSGTVTPTGVVFIDEAGGNTIVLSPGEQSIPRSQIRRALLAMQGAQYCVSGYELDEDSANYALQTARELGMKTVLNPSPVPKRRPDLSFVTLLVVNELEAEGLLALAQLPYPAANHPMAAKLLQRTYGCPMVVVTLGSEGYVGIDGDTPFSGRANRVEAVDTSGAGDGFLAAAVSCLIRGMCLRDACAWAGAYASLTVEISGTVPSYLTLTEAERRMAGGR